MAQSDEAAAIIKTALPTAPPQAESAKSTKPTHFRLFNLPAELVLRVLEFAVITSSKDHPLEFCRTQPAITRTCQLLHHEGLPLFYGKNVFVATSSAKGTMALWSWLTNIGEQNRQMIEQLHIIYAESYPQHFFSFSDFRGEFVWFRDHGAPEDLLDKVLVRAEDRKIRVVGDMESDDAHKTYQISFKAHDAGSTDWVVVGDFMKWKYQDDSMEPFVFREA